VRFNTREKRGIGRKRDIEREGEKREVRRVPQE